MAWIDGLTASHPRQMSTLGELMNFLGTTGAAHSFFVKGLDPNVSCLRAPKYDNV